MHWQSILSLNVTVIDVHHYPMQYHFIERNLQLGLSDKSYINHFYPLQFTFRFVSYNDAFDKKFFEDDL